MSDSSEHFRDQLRALEQQVDVLRDELKTVAGAPKQALILLTEKTLAEITERKAELQEYEAVSVPRLYDPHVFGSEITQGLPEYELVAGKETLGRVFVGTQEPVFLPIGTANFGGKQFALEQQLHFDLPPYRISRLDYASLEVTAPNGRRFEVPATMSGEFSNLTRSLSEEDNVNFYIDGDLLRHTGQYRFLVRFYRNGHFIGTHSLGSREFEDTKDLRLLIVVDTFPMPDAAWDTVFRALRFLQRNMPVRAGIAPMDSDLSAGLRFYVDPVPFDPDWPAWGPVAQRLLAFNQEQAAFGRPDRADKVMTVRTQQSGEGTLGGTGQMPGNISGVVLNVNPPGDSYFATIVSQEIGHNFNLGHDQAPLIPSDTAFDLLNRKALTTAQSIMYNPVGVNDFCLFSPDAWSTVRQGLLQLNSTGPA